MVKTGQQESDSSNSSPLSSSNTSGSPAVTASPTQSLEQRTITCDNIDGLARTEDGLRTAPIIEQNDDTSYMALDQLLASLALENDIMERQLSQINNNDTNAMKYKHQTNVFSFDARDHYASNGNYRNTKRNVFDENLNDVLANLIEFSENESLPYANGHLTNGHNHHSNHLNNNYSNNNHISSSYVTNGHGINNNHINRAHIYQEPSNNAIKRLTSESENSSSVSPSLSERSNGIVSWNDQVCCNRSLTIPSICSFYFVWCGDFTPWTNDHRHPISIRFSPTSDNFHHFLCHAARCFISLDYPIQSAHCMSLHECTNFVHMQIPFIASLKHQMLL